MHFTGIIDNPVLDLNRMAVSRAALDGGHDTRPVVAVNPLQDRIQRDLRLRRVKPEQAAELRRTSQGTSFLIPHPATATIDLLCQQQGGAALTRDLLGLPP